MSPGSSPDELNLSEEKKSETKSIHQVDLDRSWIIGCPDIHQQDTTLTHVPVRIALGCNHFSIMSGKSLSHNDEALIIRIRNHLRRLIL